MKKKVKDLYFGPIEEEAVKKYITSDNRRERNEIYNDILAPAFNKMIESIIKRYRLFRRGYSYEDLHLDTLSDLITKVDVFDMDMGKKAYSYYGTICKNYLLAHLIKDNKELKRIQPVDDINEEYGENDQFIYTIDDNLTTYKSSDFIKDLIISIESELEKEMKPEERKLGLALVEIFNNIHIIFNDFSDNNKYNKSTVLFVLRELTGMNTKEIRNSVKRYKKLFDKLKGLQIDLGFI